MNFVVLGATGMAGHTIAIYLKEQGHHVLTLTRKPFLFCDNIVKDVTDLELVKEIVTKGETDAVINCIGILNQSAEDNKHQAVFLNSYLPHYLSHITQESNTKIIQMSTDCVFSGRKGNYLETSPRDGATFYDRSKALGELENKKDLTFRNSIIGPDMNSSGIGLFNWFMKQNGEITGYGKVIWTGVTTLVLAKAVEKATKDNLVGVYHLVNNATISKYEMLNMFNKEFKNDHLVINRSDDIIVDKSLINNRTDFDFVVPSYQEMIYEMKDWIMHHKELYPHYFDN